VKLSERNWITEDELEEAFDDALDQQDIIKIGSLTFSPSKVLRLCDPIAYRIGLDEYADIIAQDGTFVEGYTDPKEYGYDDEFEEDEDAE